MNMHEKMSEIEESEFVARHGQKKWFRVLLIILYMLMLIPVLLFTPVVLCGNLIRIVLHKLRRNKNDTTTSNDGA